MSKIFLFGIGGTGARVIRSLVMLAASGVDIQTDAIVPIIIDPDFANADLTRTIDVLKHYSSIRKKLDFNADRKNKFFKTDFHDVLNGYRFTIQHTHGKKYREFIQYDTLGRENKALASILFSGKNLDLDMELGFKGNPNIGSVVLNQFTETDDFTNFAAAFQPGDRIFIVSSIFGGTGASGFPLILKNIRSVPNNFPNCDALRKAPIGAISVLPYFDVKPVETSQIDSSTFISKTKAALHYYEKNVTGQNSSINVLYYVGDEKRKEYPNNEGGNTQRNLAHIVELAASLAIVDFASIQNDNPAMNCQIDNDRIFAPNPLFKEFGMDNDAQQVLFSDLSQQTRKIICAPMTQFSLTAKYIQEEKRLKHSLSLPWTKDNKINETF